jgi:hypothetical protein
MRWVSRCSRRSHTPSRGEMQRSLPLGFVLEVRSRRHGRDAETGRLVDVIADEGEQRGVSVLFEAALDEVCAAAAVRGHVDDADHPADALNV